MKWLKSIKEKYKNMSEPVKASFWFTICNILNKGIALLATPIFTRLMTTEEYGQFTVYQSWNSLLMIFTSMNLFFGGYEKGLLKFEKDRDRLTSSLYGLSITITSIYFVLYLILRDEWTEFSHLPPALMIPMFVELLIVPAYDFWVTQKRFSYEYKIPVLASLFLSTTSVILGTLWVMNTERKVCARVYSNMIIWLVVAGTIAITLLLRGRCFFNGKYWLYALKINIPLIPHFLSTMLLNQADRIMIQDMVSSSAAGIYGVAYSVGMLVLLIVNGVNNSYTPYCYYAMKNNQYGKVKKSSVNLTLLMGVLVTVSMIFTPEIIYIFAGEEYCDAVQILPVLAMSVFFIFTYSLFSTIEYYFEKSSFISVASIICAVLNIVLNKLFIPIYGYHAAGYTTLFCYIFFTITHMLFCKKVLKDEEIDIRSVFDLKKIFLISFVAIMVMIFLLSIYDYIIIRYGIMLIICAACWTQKTKILEILNFKKEK